MTRKIAFFALLFVLFAVPAFADSGVQEEGQVLDVTASVVTASVVDASVMEEASPAEADVDTALFQTFEETLEAMAAESFAAWCGGWGVIPGCTSTRQCYSPDKCDYTGGICSNNCCYCY